MSIGNDGYSDSSINTCYRDGFPFVDYAVAAGQRRGEINVGGLEARRWRPHHALIDDNIEHWRGTCKLCGWKGAGYQNWRTAWASVKRHRKTKRHRSRLATSSGSSTDSRRESEAS